MTRPALAAARRVVVKVGSSSLTSLTGGLDPARLDALVDALAKRRAAGSQVVLVSSGAIAAGLAPLGLARRPRDLATQQAAAAVGQLLLAEAYARSFARYGQAIGQVLLTADDMIRRAHYRNAQRTLERLLGLDVLPVVNENDTVATDEIRVGDNDRLAALVAHIVGADALVLLSDVDGLYDGDPAHPDRPPAGRRGRADGPRRRHRGPRRQRAGPWRYGHQDHRSGDGRRIGRAGAARGGRGGGCRARHVRDRAHRRHGVPTVGTADVGAPLLVAARRRRARPSRPRRGRRGRGARPAPVAARSGHPRHLGRLRGRRRGGPRRARTASSWPAGWWGSTRPSCPR